MYIMYIMIYILSIRLDANLEGNHISVSIPRGGDHRDRLKILSPQEG